MMRMLLRATYKDFKGAQSPHLGELLLLYSPELYSNKSMPEYHYTVIYMTLQ